MREYGIIHRGYWTNREIANLTDKAKLLGAYLLTNEHSSMIGAYRLPVAYAAADLGWNLDQVEDAIKELETIGFVETEPEMGWLFLPKFLKFNPIENPNQAKCLGKTFKLIPEWVPFRARLAKSILEYGSYISNDFKEKLAKITNGTNPSETLSEPFLNPSETVSKPSQNPFETKNKNKNKNQNKNKSPVRTGERGCGGEGGETKTPAVFISPEKIVEMYHERFPELPKVRELTRTLRGNIQSRIRENRTRGSPEYWQQFFDVIRGSPFLLGETKKSWRGSLSWFVRPVNFSKIINGEFLQSKQTANINAAAEWLQEQEHGAG